MADGPAYWNRHTQSFENKPSHYEPPPAKTSPLPATVQEAKGHLTYGMHLLTLIEERLPSVSVIQTPGPKTRFQNILSAVQNRSTSKPEDEPICTASLLGLDLQQILDASGVDERMMKFYQLLDEIPTAIVFAEFGVPDFLSKNISTAPYRWAPRSLSLLERPTEINLAQFGMRLEKPALPCLRRREDDGLHIQHPGLVFDDTELTVISHGIVFLDTSSGARYSLFLALSDKSSRTIHPVALCVDFHGWHIF